MTTSSSMAHLGSKAAAPPRRKEAGRDVEPTGMDAKGGGRGQRYGCRGGGAGGAGEQSKRSLRAVEWEALSPGSGPWISLSGL
jgi:hypothetical protein